MTDAELDEIEARARAATPGRWWCETGGLPGAWCLMAFIDDGEPKPVKAVLATRPPWEHRAEVSEATGVFIAHARQDVPALVAEVKRLRAGDSEKARALGAVLPSTTQGR